MTWPSLTRKILSQLALRVMRRTIVLKDWAEKVKMWKKVLGKGRIDSQQ